MVFTSLDKTLKYPRTFGDEVAEMLSDGQFLIEENLVALARYEAAGRALSSDIRPVERWLADAEAEQTAEELSAGAFQKYYGIS